MPERFLKQRNNNHIEQRIYVYRNIFSTAAIGRIAQTVHRRRPMGLSVMRYLRVEVQTVLALLSVVRGPVYQQWTEGRGFLPGFALRWEVYNVCNSFLNNHLVENLFLFTLFPLFHMFSWCP